MDIGLFEADYLPPDARRFLDLLPSQHRARCGVLFHQAAREGITSADALTGAACTAARARLSLPAAASHERADGYLQLLLAVHNDATGAKAYADFVLRWQQMPQMQRAAVKRARAQSARNFGKVQVTA